MRVRVLADFSAYPAGVLERYRSGEVHDFEDDFAALLVVKALGEIVPDAETAPDAPADTDADEDHAE